MKTTLRLRSYRKVNTRKIFGSGGWTRTTDLQDMNLASYYLLHPAKLVSTLDRLRHRRNQYLALEVY